MKKSYKRLAVVLEMSAGNRIEAISRRLSVPESYVVSVAVGLGLERLERMEEIAEKKGGEMSISDFES